MKPFHLESRRGYFALGFLAVLFIGLAVMGATRAASWLFGLYEHPPGALASWPQTSALDILAGGMGALLGLVAGTWAASVRSLDRPVLVSGTLVALCGIPAILTAGQGGVAIFPDRVVVVSPGKRSQNVPVTHLRTVWVGCEIETRQRRKSRPPRIHIGYFIEMPDGELIGLGDARATNSLQDYRRWVRLVHRIDQHFAAAGLDRKALENGNSQPFLAPACIEEMADRLGPGPGELALAILTPRASSR